jgi:hypothetical protein
MRRALSLAVVSAMLLGLGCSGDSTPAPGPKAAAPLRAPVQQPKPLPPPPPPNLSPAASPKSPEAAPKSPPPAVKPDDSSRKSSGFHLRPPGGGPSTAPPSLAPSKPGFSPSSPPSSSSPTGQHSIALSTGVALPQTGLEGTMMMFSVEYEVQGEPNTAGYFWVIERAHGKPAKLERKLAKKGTLMAALQNGWRPEDGPFHSHIEDRSGHPLSESIEMLQTGG